MRNLKRFLAMTLTMLMVVSCFSFASFAQTFDDVYDYADAIDVLSDLGVIWGYEDGTFGPDNKVERWHMALWIAKMETARVTTDDYLTIWRAEENYTDFTDIAVDQAIGAINYAADEGIIIGTSPTTFAPTAGIMYQDALTMVVRALGFGSKAMDAGYPWKYINKAAELGLENGITGVAYRDVLTRAETAQILFNALYTVDAAGKTYVSDVFGLSTVVITGTPQYKMVQSESVIKTGFVSFNILNGDGTINTDVTYHLPATAFGLTAANADNYVGASFKVTTKNNFKTLGVVIANPSEVFEASEIAGVGKVDAPSAVLTLDGTKYQAVNKYSTLYNAQGIKGDTDEILVYTTNVAQKTNDGYFKVDANYNVLNATGQIVAYYAPAITGSYATPYAKHLGNNAYVTFENNNDNQKKAIQDAGGVWNAAVQNTYTQTVNTYDLVKFNKYASAIAYDDNADGRYDRLFYTYQEFTKISYDADTLKYNVNGGQVKVDKFIDGATGAELAAAPAANSFIRYSYNPLSKYLTVYETYTYGTGLVTTVNTATMKIVIGGTQYTVGFGNFPGAAYANSDVNIGLVGKQVNFVLVDGVVVRVFDAAVASSAIVFDNITGLTAQGYATALVYVQSPIASVITIATINGYSYQQYWLLANANNQSLQNIIKQLDTGDLFTGTKDALGFWHLKTLDYTNKATEGSIKFQNGIGNGTGFTPKLAQFETSADTVYIVYNKTADRFYTSKGIPAYNSIINVNGNLFAKNVDATTCASFIYANQGSFTNFVIEAAPPVFQNDTIVYVNKTAQPTLVTNDIGSTGTLLGNTYLYGNVLDMISGKLITVHVPYNFMLDGGCFYNVYNGYVESKVAPDTGNGISTGWLRNYTAYTSAIDGSDANQDADADKTETSKKTYIFKLIAGDVELIDNALVNRALVDVKAAVDSKVFYYDGSQVKNRVMLIDETKTDPMATPVDPEITGTVAISGGLFVGNVLTAVTTGTPAEATLKYQWYKSTFVDGGLNYQPIAGATSKTWTLLADDFSSYIKVVVTAKDYTGSIISLPIGPVHAHDTMFITYDANGGSGTMAKTMQTANIYVTLAPNAFTRAGYTFAGWNTKADGNGNAYSNEEIVRMPANGMILFAQWTALSQTITYRKNGGEGTMDPQIGDTDASVTLTENEFTRVSYVFTGWNTKANGTGTAYADEANITMPVDGLILFAQWTSISRTITYDGNDSTSGSMDPQTADIGASVTLTENEFNRNGYTFAGWNTKANGSGTAYANEAEITMPADNMTLFAQWTADMQTITYVRNAGIYGSGTMAPTTDVTDSTVTLSLNLFTKTWGLNSASFLGWNTTASGSGGTWYTNGQTITMPAGGLTLYARWSW